MRAAVIVACAILIPALTPHVQSAWRADTHDYADLAGVYTCEGRRPDGSFYEGVVRIARDEGAYRMMWQLGAERHMGIGVLTDNVLAVSYVGSTPGVVAYRIEVTAEGPRLIGRWTAAGAEGRVFVETLTRLVKDYAPPRPQRSKPTREWGHTRAT